MDEGQRALTNLLGKETLGHGQALLLASLH